MAKQEYDRARPPRSKDSGHKSRHVALWGTLPVVGHSKLMYRIQASTNRQRPGERYLTLMGFLDVSGWLVPYLKDVFRAKAKYRKYPKNETGIFPMPGRVVRAALASDWGTGTLESETVAKQMMEAKPHFTLHLGDVYHLGDPAEIEQNCLGRKTTDYGGVVWPRGKRGSFALMGNHEMYSGGHGFFTKFLPEMGLRGDDDVVTAKQRAGYYCLEGEHWVVLGLDTGYHSGGVPLLGDMPGVKDIPALNVDAHFDNAMMDWLRDVLGRVDAKKPVVVLTHHQPLSAFEAFFTKPAKQLASLETFQGREFVWFYGHEHRLTIYRKQDVGSGLVAYPRCIGHGGMPVDVSELKARDERVLFYDPRTHPIDCDHPGTKVGYNGHVLLTFEGRRMLVEYRDIVDNDVLLAETFEADGSGGLRWECGQPARALRKG